MKLMGIDYGSKRVGIALSDDGGTMAFPHQVLLNNQNLLKEIEKITTKNSVEKIILGKSLDYKNQPNVIMEKIIPFKKQLEKELHLPVIFELEFMTSQEASQIQGQTKNLDASAATLILQSHIDKIKK